ncbi:MAG: Crp/Fnr family transcriptional regulator [Flavobacterium sp.]
MKGLRSRAKPCSRGRETLYFITDGFARLYHTDRDGQEHTTQLAGPEEFITPWLSFVSRTPAQDTLECLVPCRLVRIGHGELKQLIDDNESFKAFSLIMFRHAIKAVSERAEPLPCSVRGNVIWACCRTVLNCSITYRCSISHPILASSPRASAASGKKS